jgi:hypothetical protein
MAAVAPGFMLTHTPGSTHWTVPMTIPAQSLTPSMAAEALDYMPTPMPVSIIWILPVTMVPELKATWYTLPQQEHGQGEQSVAPVSYLLCQAVYPFGLTPRR